MSALDERLREFHRNSGCDWSTDKGRCRRGPNVAVTTRESGEGLMTFCAEHAAVFATGPMPRSGLLYFREVGIDAYGDELGSYDCHHWGHIEWKRVGDRDYVCADCGERQTLNVTEARTS